MVARVPALLTEDKEQFVVGKAEDEVGHVTEHICNDLLGCLLREMLTVAKPAMVLDHAAEICSQVDHLFSIMQMLLQNDILV